MMCQALEKSFLISIIAPTSERDLFCISLSPPLSRKSFLSSHQRSRDRQVFHTLRWREWVSSSHSPFSGQMQQIWIISTILVFFDITNSLIVICLRSFDKICRKRKIMINKKAVIKATHCSKLEKVLAINDTPQF